jgi:lysine 6-dehydrogenase
LNYSLFFAVKGLINEYIEPVEVLRNGRRTRIEPLHDVEEIDFGPEFGSLEAFSTSGGVSTLPMTWEGKIAELDYKTIRYRGHVQMIRAILELGFFSKGPLTLDGRSVSPRDVSEAVLERSLPHDDDDVVLVRVIASGRRETVTYQIVDRKDHGLGHSAMMRTTGYPTAIIARFIGHGIIRARGVIPGERCVPTARLIAELRERGIDIQREHTVHA